MPDGQTYFNVELVGDYFVASATGSVVRPFGPVKLKMRTWNSCQMLARQHLLPNLLSKADPEYKSIRRCVVLGVTTAKDDAVFGMPIKFMSVKQIEQEVKSNGIPIRVDMYPDIITLRSKLRMARENPERFKQSEQKHVQAFSKLGDAIDLNAGLFDKIRDEQNASPNLSTTSNSIKKRVEKPCGCTIVEECDECRVDPTPEPEPTPSEPPVISKPSPNQSTADLPEVKVTGGATDEDNEDFEL